MTCGILACLTWPGNCRYASRDSTGELSDSGVALGERRVWTITPYGRGVFLRHKASRRHKTRTNAVYPRQIGFQEKYHRREISFHVVLGPPVGLQFEDRAA